MNRTSKSDSVTKSIMHDDGASTTVSGMGIARDKIEVLRDISTILFPAPSLVTERRIRVGRSEEMATAGGGRDGVYGDDGAAESTATTRDPRNDTTRTVEPTRGADKSSLSPGSGGNRGGLTTRQLETLLDLFKHERVDPVAVGQALAEQLRSRRSPAADQ